MLPHQVGQGVETVVQAAHLRAEQGLQHGGRFEQAVDGPWIVGCARCVLRGEVDLALRLGEAAPEGRIQDVAITLRRP